MIDRWFPTLIYSETLSGHDNKLISNYCEDIRNKYPANHQWRCNTYSSMNSGYKIYTDEYFNSLVSTITNKVGEFSQFYGMGNCDIRVDDGWINISGKGDYQEYHQHAGSHFSAVYYVSAPENCGDIVFRSYEANFDMFPLNPKELNENTFKTTSYKAVESNLLIFRSSLLHTVEMNNSAETEKRISIAMNFIVR